MGEYTLSNTAAVVDASIQKVAGADTTPTDISPLMVTSGGVKAYVDTAIAGVDVDTSAIEADVAALRIKVATYSRTATTTYGSTAIIQLSEDSDPDNIGTVLTSGTYGGGVRVSEGIYLINCIGEFAEDDSDFNDYFIVNLRSSGTTLLSDRINETGNSSTFVSVNFVSVITVPAGSTRDINILYQEVSATAGYSRNVSLTLVKLA